MPNQRSYGSWSSPISPSEVQRDSIRYMYLFRDQNETCQDLRVFWIESRPMEQGRSVVISKDLREDVGIEVWTPKDFSACSMVHEYGGAACFVHSGSLYFSNEKDHCLYKQILPQSPPEKISKQSSCRYANGLYSESLKTVFIVREDHTDKDHVVNTIVTIHNGVEKIFLEGADFYSSPRVSKSGENMCWVEWMFPNMPWDNTKVCVTNIKMTSLGPVHLTIQVITTGSDNDPISCALPTWTAYDNLCYISDESGYWNLWVAKSNKKTNLTDVEEDLVDPMWLFDNSKYNYCYTRNELVIARKGVKLEFMQPDGTNRQLVNFGDQLSYIGYCQLMSDGSVVALAYSNKTKRTIYRLFRDGTLDIIGQNPVVENIDAKYFSDPQFLTFPSGNSFSYGYLYKPCNPDFYAPNGTLPPLLVQVHGGPTSNASTDLNLGIQYWTSRGYTVFVVDHRGSTGYGKSYRNLLKGQWGVYDVEDCCNAVKFLIQEKLVDENMIAIRGGSAGGYTTLCCLTFSSVFKAGSSSYGIGDLNCLAKDTHKFESRYLDILVGDFKEQNYLYRERSPINFPEKITSPIIFFQGDKDPIVPKEQSEKMFESVKEKGLPCSLVIYAGERHGFKKMENIIHHMESEYYFFAQIFGFETPDIVNPTITIENFRL